MKLVIISCENTANDPLNNIVKLSYVSSIESLNDWNLSPMRVYCLKHDSN